MKRRWFQIHLSTALVLMVVASWVLYLNLPVRFSEYIVTSGWPSVAYLDFDIRFFSSDPDVHTEKWTHSFDVHRVHWGGAAVNVLVAAAILFVTMRASEFIIRRREAPKP
jgi:hypothetical protein